MEKLIDILVVLWISHTLFLFVCMMGLVTRLDKIIDKLNVIRIRIDKE